MAAIPTTDTKGNEIANHEMRVEASQIAIETLRALGHADLIDYLTIEWPTRCTRRMGDAIYIDLNKNALTRVRKSTRKSAVNGVVCRVRFSPVLWPRATEKERRETVIHEIAHIVVAREHELSGRTRRPKPHGTEWKRVMLRAGVTPKRCHNVDTKGLKGKKTRKTEVAHCNCEDHDITPAMAKKIGNGALYYCRSCKGYLLLGSMHSHLPKVEAPKPTVISGYTIPTPKALGF